MRVRDVLVAVALVATVALAYAPAAGFGFLYDDYDLIVDREPPRSAGELAQIFAERHWPTLPYYRPIPRTSMLVQKALHGNSPAPYHVLNVALLAAITVAAYALLRQRALALSVPLAAASAALFALHPIASSCVYPIASGRETLWPTLFEILAVLAFLRAGSRAIALCLLATAAALLSKEHAVVLPGIFVLADLLGLSADAPGRSARAWLVRYAPFAALLVGYFALRRVVFAGQGSFALALVDDPWGPLLSAAYALHAVFAPTRELVYEPVVSVWLSAWRLAFGAIATATLVAVLVLRGPSSRRIALFWLGWIAFGLLPTANLLVQEARFDERYVFFALLGFVALLASAVEPLWSRRATRTALAAAGVALLAGATALSVGRAPSFASDAVFLAQWMRTDPSRAQPHLSLGKLAARERDWPASIAHLEAALAREPGLAEIHNALGLAYEALGRTDEAERAYRRALELAPASSLAQNNLGVLFLTQGKLAEAVSAFEAALAADPEDVNARINLALTRAKLGDSAAAVAGLEAVLASRPGHAGACFNLGALLAAAGDDRHARVYLQRAVDARPDYALAHYWLAVVLARLGEPAEAELHRARALALDPGLAS